MLIEAYNTISRKIEQNDKSGHNFDINFRFSYLDCFDALRIKWFIAFFIEL